MSIPKETFRLYSYFQTLLFFSELKIVIGKYPYKFINIENKTAVACVVFSSGNEKDKN